MKSSNLEKKIDEWLKQKSRADPLSLNRDELMLTIEEPWVYNKVVKSWYFTYPYINLVSSNLEKNLDLSDFILKKDSSYTHLYDLKTHMVKTGLYCYDLEISSFYEHLNKQAKIELIKISKDDVARKAILEKDQDVRLIGYLKLGVSDQLDKMLKDKAAQIRKSAMESISYFDPRISNLINERSKYVFVHVINKIEKKNLPLLLANSNMKETYVRNMFNSRIKRMENQDEI
jgi:hypothetical protein